MHLNNCYENTTHVANVNCELCQLSQCYSLRGSHLELNTCCEYYPLREYYGQIQQMNSKGSLP